MAEKSLPSRDTEKEPCVRRFRHRVRPLRRNDRFDVDAYNLANWMNVRFFASAAVHSPHKTTIRSTQSRAISFGPFSCGTKSVFQFRNSDIEEMPDIDSRLVGHLYAVSG
jgi:hypothetical protein